MNAASYAALKKALQGLQKTIVKAQIAAARGPYKAQVQALHAAAETGGGFDAFAGVIARRSTVQFLLRTLYARAMEDLQLIDPPFIRGQRSWQAFREVAPSLGLRAYLRWVFRDLAVDYPDLFAQRADELPLPAEGLCQQVWDLWHDRDASTDTLRFDWSGEAFDSRFLGDLYQDLDKEVRKRFALLQTPDFVEEYILDHTLTPAIAHFDPAAMRERGERFRIIDPTCGSGHFLTGAFHRLADYWEAQGLSTWDAAVAALDNVWGCDINPHAVHIAQVRLLLEVINRTGERDSAKLAALPIHLRVMDSLIPWEGTPRGHQAEAFAEDRLSKYGDAAERAGHAAFLEGLFEVVVGNPPYITPKDKKKDQDYRAFWPDSASGRYGLAAPYVERLFTLGVEGGFMGQITGNSFMKRSFGRPLVEKVMPHWDLTDIVDTSGAYIPGHGTPTVTLIGRCRTPVGNSLRVLGGKRGEPKAPKEPRDGKVWRSIVQAGKVEDDSDSFITVSLYEQAVYAKHPWNVNGGGAPELQQKLSAHTPFKRVAKKFGMMTILKQDEVYLDPPPSIVRTGSLMQLVHGAAVRDYTVDGPRIAAYPYDPNDAESALPLSVDDVLFRHFWRYKDMLLSRTTSGFKTLRSKKLDFYIYPFHFPQTYEGFTFSFAFVATHNHFVLSQVGRAFNRTSPAIKLPETATLDDHLDLLGLLNSSTLGFWMKQVFFDKGFTGGGAFRGDDWEVFFEYDSTKLKQAPITTEDRPARVALAKALDATAQERAACLPAALLATDDWTAKTLPEVLEKGVAAYQRHTHRMVALQEELDWLTYQSYGLLESVDVRTPATIEPIAPGHRPFEIVLARHNATCDADERSAWFSRHGHDETTTIPDHYSADTQALWKTRLGLIAQHAEIRLIEQPQFKRRWQLADFEKATHAATRDWLLDRLEDLFADGGPLAEPEPYRLEAVVQAWREDPRVRAVAAIHVGDNDVDLSVLAEQLLRAEGVPDNIFRVYTDEGLRKLRKWQEIWRLQDREDAGETVKIPKPPEFKKGDFIKEAVYKIRGKLNVPRERFIVFNDLTPARYGWNGWRDTPRALAQLEVFTQVESDPIAPLPRPSTDDPRRCGATVGLWESLPDVKRWGDAEDHAELLGEAQRACGQQQCPCDVGKAWREWRAGDRVVVQAEATADDSMAVRQKLLAAQQRVVKLVKGLYQPDMLDASKGTGPRLLDLEKKWTGSPAELASLLDGLVASGDLTTKGRGRNTRYTPNR
jgi:hypothetical protein